MSSGSLTLSTVLYSINWLGFLSAAVIALQPVHILMYYSCSPSLQILLLVLRFPKLSSGRPYQRLELKTSGFVLFAIVPINSSCYTQTQTVSYSPHKLSTNGFLRGHPKGIALVFAWIPVL